MLLRSRASMLAGPLAPKALPVWRAAYSRPFRAEIERASKESNVEALFLTALSREESTFDHEIVSWAGAVGLAQLMPGTAVLAHFALKLGKLDPERLTEPELNLRLGARVLKDGLVGFGALEPLALVAYNAGPGQAKKLVEDTPKPFDRWVEEIKIRETRKYVKRVLETWGVYRFLYDTERPFIPLPDAIGGGTP
jgi:soluble lytic murein transglycosylase